MNRELQKAIRDTIKASNACSVDHLGYVQSMPVAPLIKLVLAFDAHCRKHGLKRILNN